MTKSRQQRNFKAFKNLSAKTDTLRIALSEPITNRENTVWGYFKQKEAVLIQST